MIALPYDTRTDWVKIVLAAGSARFEYEGETHEIDRPEVLPIGWATPFFSEKDRRASARSRAASGCAPLAPFRFGGSANSCKDDA